MSDTELALFGGNANDGVPAHLREKMEERGVRTFNSGGIGSYVKFNNAGLITIVKEGAEVAELEDEGYLDVIILDMQPEIGRMYYEDDYDDDNVAGPTCWSDDGREAHEDVTACPTKTGLCDKCPMNEKGSSDNGEGKACSYLRMLVMLIPGYGTTLFTLRARGQSIFAPDQPEKRKFNLKNYTKLLAAQKLDPAGVVTRISVNRKSDTVQLFFGPPSTKNPEKFYLPADKYEKICQIVDDTEEERASLLVSNPMGRSSETGTKEKVVGRKAKAEAASGEKEEVKKAKPKSSAKKKKASKPAAKSKASKSDEEDIEVIPPKKKPAKKKAKTKVEDEPAEDVIEIEEEDEIEIDLDLGDDEPEEVEEEEELEEEEDDETEITSADDLDKFLDDL